jgi:serine/threonine-protein kinase HipA
MNKCPVTYEPCGEDRYSVKGITMFSRRLQSINDFPYSEQEQRIEAALRAGKMSVQGIQPKLSVRLNLQKAMFEIVDRGGRYIIKPQHQTFPELPENEDLCMRLAGIAGITEPLHALTYSKDGTFSYVIKRFDRVGKSDKIAVEDFAQLTGMDRETKYDISMEKIIPVLDRCTFPVLEKVRFFRRAIFNYLIGNEDMHLKNFSLIRREGRIELAPAYDFLSSTSAYMVLGKQLKDIEELALTLKGKKRGLTRGIWIDYFALERLDLHTGIVFDELDRFSRTFDEWYELIGRSFLSQQAKDILIDLIEQRRNVLGL